MASGFAFGAKTTNPPAFGSTTLTFGTPTGQPQPATGLSFSATPVVSTGTTPSLFGTPAPATTTTSLFGAATPSAGLFGAAASTPTVPTLSFGPPALPAATSAGTGLTFGTPASTAPSFNLSGTQPTAAATGLALAVTSTTSAPSLGFGLASTTTGGGLTFGSNVAAATTTPASLSFGLGGLATTTTSAAPAPTTTAAASRGLGGISTSNQAKTAVTTQKEVPPKDQALPNEILQTVDVFKSMVKQQKAHSSDISRCSVRDFRRVEQEIDQLSSQLNDVENQLLKNRHMAEKLKYDTAKTMQTVEIAQRTHDTPPGLQYENTEPLKFFLNLSDQFERDMQNLKMQIEAADKYVKNHKNPDSLTPQDLAMGMRKLHETFVALAGRLQSVHSQVEGQKETYFSIRKHLLQDTSNPFDKLSKAPEFHMSNVQFMHSPPKVATGPTPFNNLAFRSVTAGAAPQQNTPPPAYPGFSANTGQGFGSTAFGSAPLGAAQPSNTSLFGASAFGGQSSFGSSFQLQKPPTGNKRGKV